MPVDFGAIRAATDQAETGYLAERAAWAADHDRQVAEIQRLNDVIADLQNQPPITEPVDPAPIPKPVATVNGASVRLGGRTHTAQTPGKAYSQLVDSAANFAQFELRFGDRWPNDNRCRSELNCVDNVPLRTAWWWAASFFIPKDTRIKQTGGSYTIISQWHQRPEGTEDGGKPPCSALTFNPSQDGFGTFSIYTRGDSRQITTSHPPSTTRFQCPAPEVMGAWQHIVGRYVFDYDDGELDFWLNGEQVIDIAGIPLGYNDEFGPRHKIGAYREDFTYPFQIRYSGTEEGTADLSQRITRPLPVPSI